MKTFKNLILLAVMILLSFNSEAQEQATIILGIVPETNSTNEIVTELQGEITSTTWDKDYVHIEMKIKATDVNLEVAKYLISKERFCIKTKHLSDGSQVLFMPNFELPVYINGQLLSEAISYEIFVPENLFVKVSTPTSIYPCPFEIKPVAKLLKETESTSSNTQKKHPNPSL